MDRELAYTMCRTVGHSWDDFQPESPGRRSFGWALSLRCTRCFTERHDIVGVTGAVIQREYRYPKDYRTTRTPRSEWRIQLRKLIRIKRKDQSAGKSFT